MPPDHLRAWLAIRDDIPWPAEIEVPQYIPVRDGAEHDIRAFDAARDPERARRLLAALARSRADAGRPLTFELLAGWQRHILGTVEFRAGPAFAKGGRERYGPATPAELDACLAPSALPLAARAARTYLDICFFHPFDDGNARAAFLALVFVLAADGVALDQIGPVRRLARRADDPADAIALAELIALLITASARRAISAVQRNGARLP